MLRNFAVSNTLISTYTAFKKSLKSKFTEDFIKSNKIHIFYATPVEEIAIFFNRMKDKNTAMDDIYYILSFGKEFLDIFNNKIDDNSEIKMDYRISKHYYSSYFQFILDNFSHISDLYSNRRKRLYKESNDTVNSLAGQFFDIFRENIIVEQSMRVRLAYDYDDIENLNAYDNPFSGMRTFECFIFCSDNFTNCQHIYLVLANDKMEECKNRGCIVRFTIDSSSYKTKGKRGFLKYKASKVISFDFKTVSKIEIRVDSEDVDHVYDTERTIKNSDNMYYRYKNIANFFIERGIL